MKLYIVIIAAICAAIFFAYVMGKKIEAAQCRAEIIAASVKQIKENQKIKREINAESYNIGVIDIRRILHEKYTIAE